jgi:predicted TIM-barrel fold metal-dependent hydrolase
MPYVFLKEVETMNDIKQIIDFSTWTGNWPFIDLRYKEIENLRNKLESVNVSKAFIAPIEGILEQDPLRANKYLLEIVGDDFFSPVLIVDMSYANWEEIVDLAIQDGRVKMLKLLPNYHMYEFTEDNIAPLIGKIQNKSMLISIQMRVEDRRGQYPLMKVEDVDAQQVVKTISYFPEQTFILSNCYIGEINEVLYSVDNAYVDISSIETNNVLKSFKKNFGLDRMLFSSHCPFYYPEGNLNKLKYADIPIEEIEKVAYKNGLDLLTEKTII